MSDDSKEPSATLNDHGHTTDARLSKRKWFGFSEHLQEAKKRKTESAKPEPWLVRKLAVILICSIFVWSYYVVMGRIVVPALRRDKERRIGKTAGVTILVVFNILWLMFVWTYIKAIFVRPGFAKDFVPESDPPLVAARQQGSAESFRAGPPYEAQHTVTREPSLEAPTNNVQGAEPLGLRVASPTGTEATRVGSPGSRSKCSQTEPPPRQHPLSEDTGQEAGSRPAVGASGPEVPAALAGRSSFAEAAATLERTATHGSGPSYLNFPPPPDGYQPKLPTTLISRVPPPTALKDERFRYCKRCRILKPLRTHHCRHCKTCVLKFDHHCVFIGHCVGARNYKYFINFLQWSSLYCVFVFVLALTVTVRAPPSGADDVLDGQKVGLAVVAGFFAMFTGGLFGSHMSMVLNNITTVEHMGMQRMKERERRSLSRTLGFANFTAKRKLLEQWNYEWGSITAEGNPWWLGTIRNWSMVMGEEKLPWILPIRPRPHGDDGLDYELNPRYTRDGRWQRREHWPKEYR